MQETAKSRCCVSNSKREYWDRIKTHDLCLKIAICHKNKSEYEGYPYGAYLNN